MLKKPAEDLAAKELRARLVLYKEAVRAIDGSSAEKLNRFRMIQLFEKLLHYYLERAVAISNDDLVDVHTTETWHLLKSAAIECAAASSRRNAQGR